MNEDFSSITEEEMERGDQELFIDFRSNHQGELIIKVKDRIIRDPEVKKRVKELFLDLTD